jgi:hypothetical protein
MIRGLLVAAAVAAAAGFGTVGAATVPRATISVVADCPTGDYTNSTGTCVLDPTAPVPGDSTPPVGATAKCRDGDWSYSKHHSGTCSDHGGVAAWL